MEEKALSTLKQVGLSSSEAKVYLALCYLGASGVSPIIDKSGTSASKIYVILEKLVTKGLVTVSVRDKTKVFVANEPERLLDYVGEKRKEIEKQEADARALIPFLKAKKDSISTHPPVEFSKGARGFESIFNEMYDEVEEGESYIALGGLKASFKMQHFWYKHSQLLAKKNMPQATTYEHIAWYDKDPSIHQREKRKKYYPRVLPPIYKELPTFLVVGEKTAITDVDEDGEILTVLIRNRNLSKALKKMLEIIYDSGKVPEGYDVMPENIRKLY